ncbi:hypothetical protein CSA56_18935, partial [candidate division KSB3 bacterium]
SEEHLLNSNQKLRQILTQSALDALPQPLYSELQQAVNVTDPEKVLTIAEKIRDHNPQLAEALISLTKQFRFDLFQELFEEM